MPRKSSSSTPDKANGRKPKKKSLGSYSKATVGQNQFRQVVWPRDPVATFAKLPQPSLEHMDGFKMELREGLGGKSVCNQPVRLREKGILGFGFGVKISANQVVAHQCLRIYVRSKRRLAKIPLEHRIPAYWNGLPTDVVELRDPRAHVALCGESVGHPAVTFGTIGAVVTKNGRTFILSNNHVLANCNQAMLNSDILQPGRTKGGRLPRIGQLAEFEPLDFSGLPNDLDAALCELDDPTSIDPRVLGFGAINLPELATVSVGTKIQTFGAKTQLRRGRIEGLREDFPLEFENFGVAHFRNQIVVRGIAGLFSDRGDSGALVVTDPGAQPVGLLIGGVSSENLSFVTPIMRVLDKFHVSLVT